MMAMNVSYTGVVWDEGMPDISINTRLLDAGGHQPDGDTYNMDQLPGQVRTNNTRYWCNYLFCNH